MRNYSESVFYCLNCGMENMHIYRNNGRLKERGHRKKLYCPWCKTEGNHIECRNELEEQDFLKAFKKGLFAEEAQNSISYIDQHKWPL